MKHTEDFTDITDLQVLKKRRKPWEEGVAPQLRRNIVIALACLFFLLTLNRILLPGYRQNLARDIQLEIVATGEKNPRSLGNNVRLARIIVNGYTRDLSAIPLSGNWQYTTTDDFLFVYNTPQPDSICASFSGVISMDLVFVSEVGSGIAEIRVNGKTWDRVDLHSDNTWSERTVRYDISPLIHAERYLTVYILVFGAVFALLSLTSRRAKEKPRQLLGMLSGDLLIQALLSAVLVLCISLLQYQTLDNLTAYFSRGYLIVLEGYILVFLLMYLLYWLTQSHWLSFGLLAAVLEILLVISNIKITARGTPLLPWDFQVAAVALSVADEYDLSVSFLTVAILICTAILVWALFKIRPRDRRYSLLRAVFGCGFTAAAIYLYVTTTVFCGLWGTTSSDRVYQVSNYYENNGFVVAFTEYLTYMLPPEPPEGYSQEAMEALAGEIIDGHRSDGSQRSEKPNVIVIMSESFWDVTTVENVTFGAEVFPVYNALAQQTAHGNLLSHVFGGNTVISEFECLTGFHAAFFPTDYMVYGSHLKEGLQSAASVMSAQGYHTVAMHPYIATNYNRSTVYSKMGFDEMIFEDDFPDNAQRIRSYISDDAMYLQILEEYQQLQAESDKPLFLFGITMQNHGGYWGYNLNADTQVPFTAEGYDQSTVESMNDYFAGLHSSDAALGNLISYFADMDEEVIIIYFGDHMSDAGTKVEKMLEKQSWYNPSTFEYDLRSHTVPYLIWSNRGLEPAQLDIMDIGQLLPTALALSGSDMPYFWHFLMDLKDSFSAFNKAITVNPDGSVVGADTLTPEQREMLLRYRLLVYDFMWGENYAQQLWQTP